VSGAGANPPCGPVFLEGLKAGAQFAARSRIIRSHSSRLSLSPRGTGTAGADAGLALPTVPGKPAEDIVARDHEATRQDEHEPVVVEGNGAEFR